MAQLKESLNVDVLNSIKEKRDEVSNLIMELGQVSLRTRELKNELIKLDQLKLSMETRFDEVNEQVKEILTELEVKYPKGEIDLAEGMIYYESPE